MDASLETLVIADYVFACSLSIPRPGPSGTCPGFFPDLPDQSQYDRRLRRLTPSITTVALAVAELIATGSVRLVDGTRLGCANYAGCASKSEFAGHAAYGYCASKSQWHRGMRLLLITARRGAPLGYHLRAANENERERPASGW